MRSLKSLKADIAATVRSAGDVNKRLHSLLVECLPHVSKGTFGPLYDLLEGVSHGQAREMMVWIKDIFPGMVKELRFKDGKASLKFRDVALINGQPERAFRQRKVELESVPFYKYGKNPGKKDFDEQKLKMELARAFCLGELVYGTDMDVWSEISALADDAGTKRKVRSRADSVRKELGLGPVVVATKAKASEEINAVKAAFKAEREQLEARHAAEIAALREQLASKPVAVEAAPKAKRRAKAGANL